MHSLTREHSTGALSTGASSSPLAPGTIPVSCLRIRHRMSGTDKRKYREQQSGSVFLGVPGQGCFSTQDTQAACRLRFQCRRTTA
eukprot:1886129-Rhodomonas_salina.1